MLLILLFSTGVGWHALQKEFEEMLFFIGEMLIVMLLMYPFFKIGCIGAGDVKLLGICAGYLPVHKILEFLFFSMLAAAVFSIIKLIKRHSTKERFYYLLSYLAAVFRSGRWQLYLEDGKERSEAGICLSGPILLSVIMHIGGIY